MRLQAKEELVRTQAVTPQNGTELSNISLSPKDSRLACATHVLTSRMTARLKLYVDDLLVTGSSEVRIFKTKAFLTAKFAMKDLGMFL